MNPAAAEGHKQISEGELLLQRASEAMERLRERFPIGQCIDGPRTMPPPPRPDVPARAPALPSVVEMVERIVAAESAGRPKLAAMGLARLREHVEANPQAHPDGWAAFARKEIPLARDRVAELIGQMVHRGAMLCCTQCGAGAKCPCGCGVPYVSDHPWANADPLTKATALERAAEAVAAHPEKSNRAIAAEIGVGHQTVRRARAAAKAAAPGGTVDGTVDETVGRVGRDGRRRKAPAKPDDDRDESQPGGGRKSFLLRANAAWQLATYPGPAGEVDEDCHKLAETAAAAWASVANQLREMKP